MLIKFVYYLFISLYISQLYHLYRYDYLLTLVFGIHGLFMKIDAFLSLHFSIRTPPGLTSFKVSMTITTWLPHAVIFAFPPHKI